MKLVGIYSNQLTECSINSNKKMYLIENFKARGKILHRKK